MSDEMCTPSEDIVAPHVWSNIIDGGGKDEFIIQKPTERVHNGRFYGGTLITQALHCAYLTVDVGFDINSFHSYYIRDASATKSITFKIRRIRDGRNFAFRSVQLEQDERAIVHCELTFRKRPDRTDLKVTNARFPNVPQPERVANVNELRIEYTKRGYTKQQQQQCTFGIVYDEIERNIELRPCSGIEYLIGPQRPTLKQNVWLRYKNLNCRANNDVNYQCLVAAFMSDIGLTFTGAMPETNSAFRILPSLDHTGWLHEPKFNPNEFLLLEQECLMHSRASALVYCRLWTKSGELLASFSQEAPIEIIKPLNVNTEAKL